MKCGKCGGALGKTVEAHVTGVCPKCAGVLETDVWNSPLILPYKNIPDYTTTYESTANWWSLKTEFVPLPPLPHALVPMPEYDAEFDPPYRDEALAAIGRAFDDAIDLAYLG